MEVGDIGDPNWKASLLPPSPGTKIADGSPCVGSQEPWSRLKVGLAAPPQRNSVQLLIWELNNISDNPSDMSGSVAMRLLIVPDSGKSVQSSGGGGIGRSMSLDKISGAVRACSNRDWLWASSNAIWIWQELTRWLISRYVSGSELAYLVVGHCRRFHRFLCIR